ncbi:hypothetical protein ScPMuIL_005226, partial [Solemya velum]
GELKGVLVSHIDDFLHAGDAGFDDQVMSGLRKRVLAGKLKMENFSYVGFRIRQEADGIQLDQSDYVRGITTERLPPDRLIKKQEPLTDREATTFRSLAGCINW